MKHIFLIEEKYKNDFKVDSVAFNNYDSLIKELKNTNMLSSRVYIIGENIWDYFINLSKKKNYVCSFIKTYCDCVENIKFNNSNTFLFDIADTSISNIKTLIEKLLHQPTWSPDGVHDGYVKALYELGDNNE